MAGVAGRAAQDVVQGLLSALEHLDAPAPVAVLARLQQPALLVLNALPPALHLLPDLVHFVLPA